MAVNLFISYRRGAWAGYAGRIHDRLLKELGSNSTVFFDVDEIPLGKNFKQVIDSAVRECDAMLICIGRDFAQRNRLMDPDDFVRIEIQIALERGIPILPVLLDGSPLPNKNQLPESLYSILDLQAARIEHATFHRDLEKLIDWLNRVSNDLYGEPIGRRRSIVKQAFERFVSFGR